MCSETCVQGREQGLVGGIRCILLWSRLSDRREAPLRYVRAPNRSHHLFFSVCVIMHVFIADISLLHPYKVRNVASPSRTPRNSRVCVCHKKWRRLK